MQIGTEGGNLAVCFEASIGSLNRPQAGEEMPEDETGLDDSRLVRWPGTPRSDSGPPRALTPETVGPPGVIGSCAGPCWVAEVWVA